MIFDASTIEINKIIEMLCYEEKIKYSDEMQDIYSKQYDENEDTVDKTLNLDVEIQRHVLETFGFLSTQENLKEYWRIPSLYKTHEEIKNSVFYIRYNIFDFNKINLGEKIPNCRLINTDYQETTMNTLQTDKPLILLSGSIT